MERRDNRRSQTEDEVLFAVDDVIMRGKMLNLSRDGCMIEGNYASATKGRKISVTLLEGVIAVGEIVWTNGNRFGVGFYQKLGEATVRYFQLVHLQHESDQPPADRFGRDMPPLRHDPDFG
jgi:hypothetical protein